MPGFFAGHGRKFLFFVPLLIGVAIVGVAIKGRQVPQRTEAVETAKSVRVIDIPEVVLTPRAVGYGNVKPGKVWRAVAQVSGKIVEINPQLKKGAVIARGDVLLRIDPASYRLAIAQADANIRVAQAQIKELTTRRQNTGASLKIEQRGMALAEKDMRRKQQLFNRNTISQAAVDEQQRTVLNARQSLQTLRNSLNLMPAELDVLVAQLGQYKAQLGSARLNLQYTTITAPFDGRVSEVNVERTQFAAQGKVLAALDGIDVSEITAQVPLGRLINLVPPGTKFPGGADVVMSKLPELLGFSATVRLRGGSIDARWPARFTRIDDAIDPDTRTVGVVVAVDDPYRSSIAGIRPPLSKNMFVEVELRGRARPGQIVAPRSSLHGDTVYVVDAENRLRIRKIEPAFSQTDFIVIKKGLAAGDTIVVSDPIPAIDGMLLNPVPDIAARAALIAQAEGAGAVR